MENRFKKIAADAGLEFVPNPKVCNSRKAHELIFWATENHQGTAFHQAVFRANYVEGRDIGNSEVLADAQPYEKMEQFVLQNSWRRRKT